MPEVIGRYEHEGTLISFFISDNEQNSEPFVVKKSSVQKRENLQETFSSADKSNAEKVFKTWIVEAVLGPEVKPGFLSKGFELPQERF